MSISLPGTARRNSFNGGRSRCPNPKLSGFRRTLSIILLGLIAITVVFFTFNSSNGLDRSLGRWFYGDDRNKEWQGLGSWKHRGSHRYPPSRNRPPNTNESENDDLSSKLRNLPLITILGSKETGDEGQRGPKQPLSTSNTDGLEGSLSSRFKCDWTPQSKSPVILLAITSRRTAFKQREAIRKAYQILLRTAGVDGRRVKIQFFIRQGDASRSWQSRSRNEKVHLIGERTGTRLDQRLSSILIKFFRLFDARNWMSFPTYWRTKSEKSGKEGPVRETWLERRLRIEMRKGDVVELDVTEHDPSSSRFYSMVEHIFRTVQKDVKNKPAYVMKTDEITLVDLPRVLKSLEQEELNCNRNVFWGSSSFNWHRSINNQQTFGRHTFLLSWPLAAHLGSLKPSTTSTQAGTSTSISTSDLKNRVGKTVPGPETIIIDHQLSLLKTEQVVHCDWKEELHGWLDLKKSGPRQENHSLAIRYLWRPEMWEQALEELLESRKSRRT